MQGTEAEDYIVTNPETNESYNCTQILNNFIKTHSKLDKEKFNEYIQLFNSFVEWDDTIDKQIEILGSILKESGLGEEFKRQLNVVSMYSFREKDSYIPINDVFKEEYESKEFSKGVSFLVPELDKRTGGIQDGTICTIAGGPGSMKTTYAVNLCYNAIRQGKNVCYISLEESPFQLYCKLLSRASVDCTPPLLTSEVTRGILEDKSKEDLLEKVYPYLEKQKGNFYILGERDFINYEQRELEHKLKNVDNLLKEKSKDKQDEEEHGIDILVVDHIQLLKYASNVKDEYRLINEYVSFFRKQALSFLGTKREIIVILLSQVNREGIAYAQKHDGLYKTQHVAEASEVERASAYIVTVYTDVHAQITNQLKVGTLKLRGSSIVDTTMSVYSNGNYYQVGETQLPEQMNYSSEIVLDTSSKSPIFIPVELDQLEVNNTSTLSDLDILGF